MTEYHLRPLTAEDAEAYRTFRLFMLAEAPTAFGSHHDEAAQLPLENFRERASYVKDNFIIGAFSKTDEQLVASAGGLREQALKRRHLGLIWGMYVHPDHRGAGLGTRLLNNVLARLEELNGVSAVGLSVTVGNKPALALYESAGFEAWGEEPLALRVDGADHAELHMIRRLGTD
ncbi:MAG: GNAT family N-acetyltransferase [Pseudomonadota bacterium]